MRTAVPLLSRLIRRFRRFRDEDRAAVAFEAVIILPVLAWCFVGSFVFFEAFRTYNSSIKATYAIADVLSRQVNTVFAYDIEGMHDIFDYLVHSDGTTRMRVTQINYNRATDSHTVDWSYATNGEARLFTANMPDIAELLPVMANAERLILVETFVSYRPAFNVGLAPLTFSNFTFTRPRYAGQVPFNGTVITPPPVAGS